MQETKVLVYSSTSQDGVTHEVYMSGSGRTERYDVVVIDTPKVA